MDPDNIEDINVYLCAVVQHCVLRSSFREQEQEEKEYFGLSMKKKTFLDDEKIRQELVAQAAMLYELSCL